MIRRCACGLEFGGYERLNAHRRNCEAFWQSVYAEMERIAIVLYGRPMAISTDEWVRYKSEGFPSWTTFKKWGRRWHVIQEAAGTGVSVRGRGSLVAKVKLVSPEEIIDDLAETMTGEFYPIDIWSEGLAICVETYQRTGRMMLR